ncbi:unnamed protein product [Cylicostephanus goldi]|uniref:Uncharacterized protein n=1 Tax=Cylicostephanus goldi TaxID=71465 RepID=A0A3P6RQ70_CYLGO|nr:unnamed protein product [Cylicostephanus goldi]
MRVILLVLISISNSLASGIIEKIDKALSDIPTTLNKAELLATTEILHAHDKAVERQLQLSPQQELELHRLETEAAQLGHAYYDNHTISQINHQSHIDELLYQSDIILTTEQAQMIAKDEEAMELERERSKRQALNWNHWKNYMWPNGVLYYSFAVGTKKGQLCGWKTLVFFLSKVQQVGSELCIQNPTFFS